MTVPDLTEYIRCVEYEIDHTNDADIAAELKITLEELCDQRNAAIRERVGA